MKRLPLNSSSSTTEQSIHHDSFILTSDQTHYLIRVLRLSSGNEFLAFDEGLQRIFRLDLEDEQWVAYAQGEIEEGTKRFPLVLCYGVPKGEKLDLVVRQITEIGLMGLDLFQAQRSVSIWKGDKVKTKIKRLNKVIEQATRQSLQSTHLQLNPPLSLLNLIEKHSTVPLKIYLDPLALEGWPEGKSLPKDPEENSVQCVLLVGPEGGLDPREITLLQENGWYGVRLNTPILRTETAALVASTLALEKLGFLT